MNGTPAVIVIGFGNPGREDDGAGIAVAQRLEKGPPENVTVTYDYQLNVEDALEISGKDAVIFIDASVADMDSCRLSEIGPEESTDFTTHSISPGGVLGLCSSLYGSRPRAWLLDIKGHTWEMREGLSRETQRNCDKAFDLLRSHLEKISQNKPVE